MQLTTVSHACNRLRRVSAPLALAFLAFSAPLACHRGTAGSAPKVTLAVSNRGFFDVNVFVLKSPVARTTTSSGRDVEVHDTYLVGHDAIGRKEE